MSLTFELCEPTALAEGGNFTNVSIKKPEASAKNLKSLPVLNCVACPVCRENNAHPRSDKDSYFADQTKDGLWQRYQFSFR